MSVMKLDLCFGRTCPATVLWFVEFIEPNECDPFFFNVVVVAPDPAVTQLLDLRFITLGAVAKEACLNGSGHVEE